VVSVKIPVHTHDSLRYFSESHVLDIRQSGDWIKKKKKEKQAIQGSLLVCLFTYLYPKHLGLVINSL